eukprot:85864_1
MRPNKAPFFYILALCSILAVVSIGGMLSSFASTPDSAASNLKQPFETNSAPSDAIISRRLKENISTNFFPKQANLNEVKLDPDGILGVQKVSDANSTSPLHCSACGKLGVPLIPDNFLEGFNVTCAQYDDLLANWPIESCRNPIETEAICCDQSELLPPYECG